MPSLLVSLSHFPPFHPSRIPTVAPSSSVTMYNPAPIFLTDPAWQSRIFPTVPMLSVTGRLRGCAWSGGSPWGSPPGQDRRSFSRFQSLSYRQTFPVAVFSWQKLAPGVVFPYGSWLCWKKLRSGNCGKARWVRSVIRLSLRGPSAGAHSVQEGKTVLLLGPPHDTGKAAAAFRSCPRKVPEGLAAEPIPCPARLPRDLSLPSLIPPGA